MTDRKPTLCFLSAVLLTIGLPASGQESVAELAASLAKDSCSVASASGVIQSTGEKRLLQLPGRSEEVEVSEESWDGIQDVLEEHRREDRENYRECVRDLTRLFLDAETTARPDCAFCRDIGANGVLSRFQIKSLLIGHVEQGYVVEASNNDIGPDGTEYFITYKEDGRLTYQSEGWDGVGNWWFNEEAFCRSFDGSRTGACRRIERTREGHFEGVGFRTGNLRYRFVVD